MKTYNQSKRHTCITNACMCGHGPIHTDTDTLTHARTHTSRACADARTHALMHLGRQRGTPTYTDRKTYQMYWATNGEPAQETHGR
jgi:hypothetical protein